MTKSIDWQYEQEWRHVTGIENSPDICYINISKVDVDSVYLGCRLNQESEEELKVILKQNLPDAQIFKMKISRDNYALESQQINL